MQNNKKYIITIIILIIITIVLSILIALDYNEQSNKKEKDDNKQNINENNNNDNNENAEKHLDDNVEKELSNIIEDELSYLNNKTKISQLTNQDKLSLAYYKFVNDSSNENREYDAPFKAEELDKFYEKTSLSNYKLTHENIKCFSFDDSNDHILWNYDSNTKTYKRNEKHGGHGYLNSIIMGSVITSSKLQDNKYIISIKYIWSEFLEGFSETKVYGSYNDAKNDINSLGKVSSDENIIEAGEQYLDNNYLDIKDKLDEYVYTFEKIDNNYKLVDFYVNS